MHPDMQAGSGCDTGCGGDPNPFNNTTSVASHELVETITDCEVGINNLAWCDDDNGEIGDICNAQQGTVTADNGASYTIQLEFSDSRNDCIATY